MPEETAVVEAPAIPEEVQQKLTKITDEVKMMTFDDLLATTEKISGSKYEKEKVNEAWLRRRTEQVLRQQVYREHGIVDAPVKRTKKEKAVTEGGEVKAGPGRRKMKKIGVYKLALGEGGSMGREGSVKHGILSQIVGKPSFSYDEFLAAVVIAMKYDGEAKSFGVDTKFPSIDAAANAWWSELKNKAKVIEEVPAA